MASLLTALKLLRGFASALAICASLLPWAAQAAGAARPTIAVLPLANASGDANQDFFAEGLTDEIAVALTRLPGIGVGARSSIFRFREPSHDFPPIGQAHKPRDVL